MYNYISIFDFSWMYIFNRLAGYTEADLKRKKKPPVTMAREKYPRPSVSELVDTLSLVKTIGFLIARHPYHRLVSGYRDKILGAIKGSFHDNMCRDIVIRYRKIERNLYQHGKTVPTFSEFVRYIIDESNAGNELDMHWTPVYNFCTPCQVKLTHIIKFDTFDRDTRMILEKANVSQYLPSTTKLKENESKGKQNSSSQVNMYLNELSPEQLKDLHNLYKIDFDILGYN